MPPSKPYMPPTTKPTLPSHISQLSKQKFHRFRCSGHTPWPPSLTPSPNPLAGLTQNTKMDLEYEGSRQGPCHHFEDLWVGLRRKADPQRLQTSRLWRPWPCSVSPFSLRPYWTAFQTPLTRDGLKNNHNPKAESCSVWWEFLGLQAQETVSQVTLRELLRRDKGKSEGL